MEDIKSPSSVTIGELIRIVREFEEKIQNGTEDPDRFLTLHEIEDLWRRLIGNTNVLYSDMLQSLIRNIDEKELIRRKKGVPSQRNKITHSQARRPFDPYNLKSRNQLYICQPMLSLKSSMISFLKSCYLCINLLTFSFSRNKVNTE